MAQPLLDKERNGQRLAGKLAAGGGKLDSYRSLPTAIEENELPPPKT